MVCHENVHLSIYSCQFVDVSIHWTGLLEWTTGMDYWTHPNCHKIPFKYLHIQPANVGSLAGRGVFPSISRGQGLHP